MSIKIPLPKVTAKFDAKAHPFPIQIAFQTQEFMQAAIFYAMFSDIAAGKFVRQTDGLTRVKDKLIAEGMTNQLWEDGWKYLEKYQEYFSQAIFREVLISLRSYWDWYIRKLGRFVNVNRSLVTEKPLSKNMEDKITKIGFKEINEQIELLQKSCAISITIDATTSDLLYEMSLVRNLGLHNRWEVDAYYLAKTQSTGWSLNEVRNFNVTELQMWHSALVETINQTSIPVSIKFVRFSEYEVEA